ncbi:MAG: leucine-rich repeat domain-containing protein [Ruminococcaceae bacterium]|nr:leucine-rich repeat domain-containing protein [Oscillospiraceae bacterium]
MAQTVAPKTEDHTPVTDAAVAATCKDTGLTEGSHCSVCNKVLVAQTVAPKTEDHTPVTDAAVAATCKDTGLTEGSHCSVCNKFFVKQVETLKEPHNYIDGYCDFCKGKKVSEGLKFENHDGYAAVIGIGSCMDTVIIIPDVAPSGLPVKEIGMQAFKNCTNIKEVIIPDAVVAILIEAFMNCTSLEKITLPAEYWDMQLRTFKNCTALKEVVIPNNVFRVGVECFANCTSLKNVTIPTSVTTYSKDAFKGCAIANLYISSLETWLDSKFNNANSNPLYCTESLYLNNVLVTTVEINRNIPAGAFMGYEKLTKIVLGNSVKTIGGSAFYGCSELAEVVFGNKLETIGTSGFYNCAKLTAINLPSSLKTVSNKAFYGCSALQTVTVASGLQSVGDYAFSGCIALRTIDFPATVTYMGISCLEKCASLESITVPFVGVSTCSGQYEAFGSLFGSTQYDGGEMITQINGSIGTQAYEYSYCIPKGLKEVKLLKHDEYSSTRAFHNCKYIESITFGKGVTRVGSGDFTGCTALTYIYYEGTKEEWKNLRYSESFDSIETLTIMCSDGIIDKN